MKNFILNKISALTKTLKEKQKYSFVKNLLVFGSITLWSTFSLAQPNPGLGTASEFVLLTNGNISNTDFISCKGKVAGNVTNTGNLNASGGIYLPSNPISQQAYTDVDAFLNYCASLSGSAFSSPMGNVSLNAGIFEFGGSLTLHDTIILNGDTNSVFIFKIAGDLSVSPGCLVLLNDVRPQNVFWILNNAAFSAIINEDVSFSGILISLGNSTLKSRNSGYLSILSPGSGNITIHNDDLNNMTYLTSAQAMFDDQHLNYPAEVKCFADEVKRKTALVNPLFQNNANEVERAIHQIISNNLMLPPSTNQYVIPVVVHIVHHPADVNPGMGSNITDAQVINQINELNDYFSAVNLPVPALNMNIRFCLATLDENGQSTTGITRFADNTATLTLTNTDVSPAGQAALKAIDYFPSNRYLNIWVVSSITNGSQNYQILGYATFPNMLPATSDGIVVRYDYFGNAGNCTGCNLVGTSEGKILVHEAGHYLDIFHTFEGGCSGMLQSDCYLLGDKCCDTPPVDVQNTGCTSINSCPETYPAPLPDQIENHMDYTSEACHYVFTSDQRDRMHATLSSYRSYLVSAPNLATTGVACTGGVIANFAATPTQLCVNGIVTFNSFYIFGTPTYDWDFGDGTITLNGGNPITHQYTTAGNYDVTLTVTDGLNSVSYTQAHYIFVNTCTPIQSEKGNWYFGIYGPPSTSGGCALSFASGVPLAITNSPMSAPEAAVSQSDASGNLLFISNGINVWNNVPSLLPVTLSGDPSSAQCLSVPNPANSNQYYLFYHDDDNSSPAFYSIIDISNYSFPSLNVPITLPVHNEAITAIPHCNGTDYWIIYHTTTGFYYVYLLSNAGLGAPSTFPSSATFNSSNPYGCFDVSPDGAHIALSLHNGSTTNSIEVVNFDKTTGAISNPFVLPYASYGTSFSPNSRFLYLARDPGSTTARYIIQIDLLNNFHASDVSTAGSYVNLQAGPDNKIYIEKYAPFTGTAKYLAVINYPDMLNTGVFNNECGFTPNAVDLDPTSVNHFPHFSLPNFIDAQKPTAIIPDFTWTVSNCYDYIFTATQCGTSYLWNFGDGSGLGNTNPVSHTFPTGNGTYNVVLTISSSTTVSHQITIGIQTPPTIYGPVCIGNLNQLYNYSVNSQPGLVYDWTITGGTPPTLQNSSNIDVTWLSLAGGTVTVTATDPLTGCTSSTSIVVSSGLPLDIPVITGGDLSGCNFQSSYLISNSSSYAGCAFNWTAVPNGVQIPIITPNGASAIVNWNGSDQGGWIYVTVVCGTCASIQGSFYVQPCCHGTGSASTIVYGDMKASQLPGAPVFTSGNTEIVFNGVLTIDMPTFSFFSCTNVRFGPGAKIYDLDNHLVIRDAYFYEGCGEMWEGIVLKGKAKFDAVSWTVEDAQYAVNAQDNSFVTINGCSFNKNYAGIYVPPSSIGVSNVTLNLSNVSFDCSLSGIQTNLLPPFVTQTPLPGSKSYTGILINDMPSFSLTVGTNTFNNLNMGVTAYASSLFFKGYNIFTNIQRDLFYGNFYDGSGVAANGGHGAMSLTHTGFVPTAQHPWGFDNCRFGIYTDHMVSATDMNYMNDVNRGVVVFRSMGASIRSNTINCNVRGIDLQFNDGAPVIDVVNNFINVRPVPLTPLFSQGINASEVGGSYAANHLNINENWIHVYSGFDGIMVRNSSRPSITHNEVTFYNTAANRFGIGLRGSDNAYVSCNTVNGSDPTQGLQMAYYVSMTANSQFVCNNSDNTYYGWEFDGACITPNGFSGNSIQNHFTGLRLGTNTSVLGAQDRRDNCWSLATTYPGWGAQNLGPTPGTYPFTIDPSLNTCYLPDFDPAGWFIPGSGGLFTCDGPSPVCGLPHRPEGEGELGGIDYNIAEETIPLPEYEPETNWMAEKYLFEKLQNDTTLLNDTVMQAFYDEKENTVLGSLADIKIQMQQAPAISTALENLLSSNLQLIDGYYSSLAYNDSLIDDGSPDSIILGEENDTLRQYIKNVTLQNNTLMDLARQNSDALMNAAQLQNDLINSDEIIEQNEKTINKIYMETIYNGIYSFTTAQSDALSAIAQQCPFAGGPAVYKARSMYELIDENMVEYDDQNVCFQEGILIRKGNSETKGQPFKGQIIPNPTSAKAKLTYSLPGDADGSFVISNAVGQMVAQYKLSASDHEFNFETEKLSQGVYYYRILAKDNLVDTGKLVIIK